MHHNVPEDWQEVLSSLFFRVLRKLIAWTVLRLLILWLRRMRNKKN